MYIIRGETLATILKFQNFLKSKGSSYTGITDFVNK